MGDFLYFVRAMSRRMVLSSDLAMTLKEGPEITTLLMGVKRLFRYHMTLFGFVNGNYNDN